MPGSELSFVPLLVVIALSFIVPVALSPVRRLGIPVVVGEIIAGIVVGKSGFDLVQQDFVLEVLSVFGFAYLMFLSGLEIDFSGLPSDRRGLRASRRRDRLLRNPFVLGGAMFVLTALCSLAAGFYLRWLGVVSQPFIMALVLSTTSLGVVAPVLKERGLVGSNTYGQTILVAAMIADFVTILLISGYVLMRGQGLTVDLLLILVLLLAFLATYRLAARFRGHLPAQRLMHALSTATSQIRVRGSMAVALVFIALAESLGIENIIGAFLAGVIISLLSGQESSVLREKLDAIGYGFLIPIFFIMVGVNFDLPALLASNSPWTMVALLTAIAFGVKFVGGLVFRAAFDWRETFAASALLSSRLSLIIAVATIGVQIGAISPALDAAIILVAIITCTLSPIAFARLAPRRHRTANRTLLVGSGHDVDPLARRLRRLGHDVETLTDIGPGADGDAASRGQVSERMRALHIKQTKTVIAMADTDADNLQICRIAREVYAVPKIVAWIRDPSLNQRFIDAGALVVNPAFSKLLILESMALGAHGFAQGPDDDPDQEIRVIKLQNSWLSGRELKQLGVPEGVSVLRIERRGAVLEPEPGTIAQANDSFTVSGPKEQVYSVARRFARRW
ncbi:monovalent cation:proton antiporter family protein [Salinisphaera aquimarina]|uniref:Monovalent cation:proton antiporter family protein n=1 Tax=Salinisphaera aquimarina TaxID=2094031 RepID=A0ABV7EWT1_9GAMM